jgi:cyclase
MRSTRIRTAAAVFGVALMTAGAAAAKPSLSIDLPDWNKTPVVDHDLGGGVHMLESFGGNIGVLAGDQGVLMVDAEYPELTPKVKAAVARISPLPIRYLVDTHWHWDHVGANGLFARDGAVLISSEETRKHIADAQAASASPPGKPYARDPAALPVVTVGEMTRLHLGSHVVEIIHIPPAHTDGDLIVRFVDADVIQTGDSFFHGFYPDIDAAHGGTIDGMIAFYDRLYALCGPNTKIIPGHGDVATREDVRAYQAMLRTVRERVAKALDAGMSEDALIASHPLDDLDAVWGGNLIKQPYLLGIVYEDLAAHRAKR